MFAIDFDVDDKNRQQFVLRKGEVFYANIVLVTEKIKISRIKPDKQYITLKLFRFFFRC